MAKIRIHELAKEMLEKDTSLDSKSLSGEIVKLLQDNGSEVKNHMSSISDEEAEVVRKHFLKGVKSPKKEASAEEQRAKEAPAPQAPAATRSDAAAPKASAAPRENRPQGRRPIEGKLVGRDGNAIIYRVAPDGRLVDTATGKQLPFRMSPEGRIMTLDGRPLQRKPSPDQQGRPGQSRQGQNRPDQNRPAQPRQPMTQVFDGRSDRDKRRADNAAQNRGNTSKSGLSETLGDRVKMFESQLDPSNEAYKPEPKKVKKPIELPEMPKEEAAPAPASAEANDTPVVQDTPAPVETVQPQKADNGPKVGDNVYANRRPEPARENRGQDDRPYGERRPQGDRPYGDRRPQGDRPYGDRRPQGDRPYGDRRPQGDRPYGDRRPQGDRPYGDRPQGDRPFGNRQNSGFAPKDKDDDTRRNFSRKNDSRPGQGSSIKSELANELGKGQRAESLKDRNRDKNRKDRDRDIDMDGMKNGKTKKDPNRKGAFQKPVAKPVEKVEDDIKTIVIPEVITIKELADKMKQPSAAIIKKLFMGGKMVNLNSEISFEEAEEIALEYEIICEREVKVNVVEELLKEAEEDPELLLKRPPVVCVMGHVDHGKTSLLDAIRKTNVTSREAGGITQHIGAYMVEINGQKITFLDTPGHEAFTSMRMRGAKSTDIAILVIAADDGVMPQTVEAINHAKAANVQIIVAVNKIDKPGANIDRVKQELTEHGLVAEDWGGDTVFVPVSAKTGEGIETLLEMVLLTADVCELKANPNRRARGIVIEAKLDKGRGPVATVLIQKGTLNVGDNVVIGAVHGKVRAMVDDLGHKVKVATPSTPVELLGLNGVPQAGETMMAVTDEKEARTIAEAFIAQSKEEMIAESRKQVTLENMFSQMHEGELKNLNLIVKADVMGSVEAVKQSLVKLSNEEVVVRIIHGGVGNINESDVNLAAASQAIIIGFNVKPDNTAKEISEREKVDVRLYRVIYDAIDDIELAMKGMLKPIYEEKVLGHAEVRQLFKASGLGIIAGSFVLDGKIERGCSARISRGGTQIFDGALASLKRFKDDVKEVAAGYECGLVFEKFNDLAELDQVEFYTMVEVPRK